MRLRRMRRGMCYTTQTRSQSGTWFRSNSTRVVSAPRLRQRPRNLAVMNLKRSRILLIAIPCPALSADTPKGSVCISPVPEKPIPMSAPGLNCASGKLSFRIDAIPETPWPVRESIKIGDLDLGGRHRVTIMCDSKPQQSFRFRYSEYEKTKLRLFINDLYKTAQLWEDKDSPWCKCR